MSAAPGPDPLVVRVRELIATYRDSARWGGRHDIAAWPDRKIWERIRALASYDGPEPLFSETGDLAGPRAGPAPDAGLPAAGT